MSGGPAAGDVRSLLPSGVAGRWALSWTRLVANHRWAAGAILVVQAIVFSALSAWIVWQPDVLLFFSSDSAEVRNVRAVAEKPGLANQLRFDVHLAGPPPATEKTLVSAAARDLAQKLQASEKFNSVWTGVEFPQLAAAYAKLQTQAPLLLNAVDRAQVETRLTGDFLQRRFAAVKDRLADPDGEFLLRALAADPLDLSQIVTARLQSLSPVNGNGSEAATFEDGLLMTQSAGRWHAMIVTEPRSLPSNQKAAEATLAAANAAIAQVAGNIPGTEVWTIGAHRGYVENARRIMTDVEWVSIVGTLAVGLAIALYFRRIWAALICMLPPVVGVGLALGVAGIFHVTLPLLLLGFAGLLCGSTTDYGIQLIAECRRIFRANGRAWHPDIPAIAARRMLGPISMSVATSVTGFAALSLSAAPGLRMLGLFVASATLCIWVVTFLVLPGYLGPWVLPKQSKGLGVQASACNAPAKTLTPTLRAAGLILFLTATLWMALGAMHVKFNMNPHSLDGSPPKLQAEETAFANTWGDPRNHAIVLAQGPTAEQALHQLGRVRDYLSDQQRDGLIEHVTSPADILPPQATIESRATTWTTFWTPQRREQLRAALTTAAVANGFKPSAFTGYADTLAALAPRTAEQRLTESPATLFPGFIERSHIVPGLPVGTASLAPAPGRGVTLASIVQMCPTGSLRMRTAWAPELRARFPDTVIVAGNNLFFDATDRARAEGERVLPWCMLAILLPLILYFRRLTRAWLIMLCLLAGLVWVVGSAQFFGGGLNLLSLVPLLFTLGVAVDYGIYLGSPMRAGAGQIAPGLPGVTHQSHMDPALQSSAAPGRADVAQARVGSTAMCALTTILGSGALLLAGHPAMRWLGVTLVAGVVGGVLAAIFVVQPLASRVRNAKRKIRCRRRALVRVGWLAINVALLVLTLALAAPLVGEMLMRREAPAGASAPRICPPLQQTGRRAFAVGESWMRWRPTDHGNGLWEMKLAGGPFDRGHAAGIMSAPVDFRIETEMLEQLDSFLPDEWARWLVLRGVGLNMLTLPRYIKQEYQQEIWASATAGPDAYGYLAPSYPRILSYHALHDVSQMLIDNPLIVPNTFACTGVVSLPAYTKKQGGHLLLARVFDFEGGESFGRQKSVTHVVPPPGDGIAFVHVAWPGLAGCVTGMNAAKIAVFLNAAATRDHRRIGTPTILMARDILQHATSIADAERIIRSTTVFVSDIIVVADGKTGAARVFEKSPGNGDGDDGTDFYDVSASAVATNHLVTPRFKTDPVNLQRIAESTTMQRYARAREILDGMKENVTVEGLARLLRDKKGPAEKDLGIGNRNAIDAMIACHGVIMDATTGEIWVAGWPNVEGKFLRFNITAQEDNEDASYAVNHIPADAMLSNGRWQQWRASEASAQAAAAALRSNHPQAAKVLAEDAIRGNPNFYYNHELLGRALLNSGDPTAARKEFSRALELDPPYAKRRTEITSLLKAAGR